MGTGKKIKCNECGAEWLQFCGVGFEQHDDNTKPQTEESDKCPECGSTDISDVPDITILWD